MSTAAPLPCQPCDALVVHRHRRPLVRTSAHLAAGGLSLGFLGGSITQDGECNWPGPLARWFAQAFPLAAITVENAAMGATGSNSACLRVQQEIIERGCQLTFVEFAVNDYNTSSERRGRTREGLIRKLLASGSEVVLVYTFSQKMYVEMMAGVVPPSIAEFEVLAEHYGLGSVWVGLQALNEVRRGIMKWGEWLPDGLHPAHRGGWSYAQAVIQFLEVELRAASVAPGSVFALPAPTATHHWQGAALLPLTSVARVGPWVLRRVHNHLHTGQVLESHTPGARLVMDFDGAGLALIIEYGKRSADFAYRLDGGEWTPVERTHHDWGGDCGMVDPWVLSDELPRGRHRFELELVHGNRPDCTGTEFRLAQIGVL